MAISKRLGLYWGETGLDLVEIGQDGPRLNAKVSFSELEDNPIIGVKTLTEDLRLLDLLQKTIRNSAFSTVDTYLSLPSKDIIIRWFVIPWMRPSEIEGVVSFEARKYLPFPLEELVYTYYPSPFSKGSVRQIGIIFISIRKANLDKYVNVLLQAGLNVVCSEPSSMSLIRSLVMKKAIDVDKVTAVLNVHQDSGEILITSQGFVKFTRDFKIHSPAAQQSGDGQDVTKAKFFNEVKIALEFFSRQHVEEEVQKIIVLSSGTYKDVWSGLAEELSLPVTTSDILSIFKKGEPTEIGFINAYGAALSGVVPVVVDFNLSEGQGQSAKAGKVAKEALPTRKIALLVMAITLGLSSLVGTYLWTQKIMDSKTALKVAKSAEVGTLADTDISEIKDNIEKIKKQLDAVRSLRFKGSTTAFVINLVKILPPGVWLNSISLDFVDVSDQQGRTRGGDSEDGSSGKSRKAKATYQKLKTKATLNISGYCFLEDANAEFEVVNNFVITLRSTPDIASRFKDIKLGAVRSETQEGKQVVSFSISCD
jgi:hypothetical protein